MPTLIPQSEPIFWRVKDDDSDGVTLVTENTAVSPTVTVVFGEGEIGYLAAVATDGDSYPPLPAIGEWLEQGDIYDHGGTLLMVRQSHWRTIYEPADTPALFIVWRENAGEALEWVAGEQVQVGTRRMYAGVLYEAIQGHVTEATWIPPAVPALWRVVVTEPAGPAEWAAGVAYKVGDRVTYQGVLYECRQAHTAIVSWEPPRVLALWLPVGPA